MDEIDIVLLDQRELPAVLKDVIVFKASFDVEKELSLSGAELRAETEAEHTVFVADETVLVEYAAAQ